MRIPWLIPIAGLLAILVASPTQGQTFHGRLTTSFYAWERLPTDSTSANHLRAFQLGIFHVDGVADPRLSFHTYVRLHGDLAEDVAEPANYSVFNLYGQWKDVAHSYELRGGRQRVYAGVGNVAIDGGWGSYRFRPLGTFEGYVGVQVPLDGDYNLAGWDDRAYGARLTIDRVRDLKLALSFARRNRATLDYDDPGIYTGRLLELPDEQEQLYGSDLSWRFRPGATLYNRIEVDATQRRLKWAGGTLSLAYPNAPWSADVEYMHRAPSIYANSIFSVFDAGDYDEVSVRGGVWVAPKVRAFGQVAATFFDGDDSERFLAGVERGALSVSYQHRLGYGGDLDGVSAAYRHPLRDWITLRADGGISSFRFEDGQEERNVSGTVAAGAELRPRRDLGIDLEIQNLSQDLTTQPTFAGDTYDLRGLVRVSYWFSTGRPAKGAF